MGISLINFNYSAVNFAKLAFGDDLFIAVIHTAAFFQSRHFLRGGMLLSILSPWRSAAGIHPTSKASLKEALLVFAIFRLVIAF